MRFPRVDVDWVRSNSDYQLACEVFGDSLKVQLGEPFYGSTDAAIVGWGNSLIDLWCELRGLEQVFYDLVEEPEFTHEAMQFLMEGTIEYINKAEKRTATAGY